MLKVMVITHGRLGEELVKTAECIAGKQDEFEIIRLDPEDSLATMCDKVKNNLSMSGEEGAIVLTDMLGGTPCNACLPFCNSDKVEVISGINLYMLLSVFMNRKSMGLSALAEKAVADGIKSIVNAKEMFLKKMK
jgi:PTS system mannose-specific IIA component